MVTMVMSVVTMDYTPEPHCGIAASHTTLLRNSLTATSLSCWRYLESFVSLLVRDLSDPMNAMSQQDLLGCLKYL